MNVAFPDGDRPDHSRIHTRNELLIRAPVDVIWRRLIRAAAWHTFYDNCKDLHFEPSSAGPDLGAGTTFVWRTFGIRVRTTVVEWDPPHRFAWKGKSWAGRGYHGWVLERAGSSTRVLLGISDPANRI